MSFITKYKFVILVLVLIPIALGVACYYSVPFFNEAGSSAWLSFWGGYIGSSIMAAVTLYVLDRQLIQNQEENLQNRNNNITENKANRELSEKFRSQEIEIKWFEDLKRVSSSLYSAFNSNDVIVVSDMNPLSDDFHYRVTQLLTRMNEAYFNFQLTVNYNNNVNYSHETVRIQYFVNQYLSLLADMDSLHIYGIILQEGLSNIDSTKEEFDTRFKGFILKHKKTIEFPEIKENRVWDLLIDNRFDNIEYISEVLSILRKRVDNFPMIEIGNSLTDLVQLEYKKITAYNGTK